MRAGLPTGTVTFLFTDVEGSTRLLHELGAEGYAEALAEHRRAIREACTAEGGVEVDTQGDSFFFAFATAPGALAAAAALTGALATGPVRVRVGLHTGTPHLADGGYTGRDVVVAARISAAAHGGQVALSSATRELLEDRSVLVGLGEHRFKDIDEAVPIFQLGPAIFPPLKTISNTNLPWPATSFVGRDEELGEIVGLVEDGARLLTLTGPGGTGKTRLAVEVARALVSEYRGGVFWVGLAALRDPALVTGAVARAVGARNGLSGHIGERQMLVLVDNLEQVIDAAVELAELVQACPNLSLLVTSREVMRVTGEVEYAVPPLAAPDAVSLFCQRSGLEPGAEIPELCARLDSLPLAVELAAARTRALSPAQILQRLSSRLDLLKGGRDADPRQQTLRTTIEWSYELLEAEEQRLFARLAVFTGGWALDGAEAVCETDVDTLQSLVEKSLVRFSGERYWMFETIREYARERLAASGDWDRVRERHTRFFAETAQAMHREWMYGTEMRAPSRWFRDERENLRAAVECSADDLDVHLPLLHDLRSHWTLSMGELRSLLESALARADDMPAGVRARALAGAADAAAGTGDHDAASAYREQALALYRSLGDHEGVARCLVGVGRDLVTLGRTVEAREQFEEGLRTAQRARSRPVMLGATSSLAQLALYEGDFERALELVPDLEKLEQRTWNISAPVVGLVALERGDAETAARQLGRSIAGQHGIGTRVGLSFDLDAFAAALVARGEVEQAVVLHGYTEALRESLGYEPDSYALRLRARVAEAGRAALGDDLFAAAVARGASLSLDDAVEYALASLD